MLGKRKSLPALKVFLHHKAEVVSNPNNTSPRSSGESDSSVESLEEEGGRARKVKSMQVSNTPSPYYDEFTASADLSALSISSEDATLLDVDDPFGSDPFASTPPASPRTAYHPVGANFLDEDPYASPLASPTTLQSFPSEIPSASPVPPVPSTLRPPSAVKHHSPLSPIKDTFPTVASETKPQPRRHELPKPQQPSLEMLSVVVMQAPTRSRRRGKVGANLPLEPWSHDEPLPLPVTPPDEDKPKTSVLKIRHVRSHVSLRSAHRESHTRHKSIWGISDDGLL